MKSLVLIVAVFVSGFVVAQYVSPEQIKAQLTTTASTARASLKDKL
jgi:hypothetical protein